MTVTELRKKLQKIEKHHPDDEVTVHCFGGLCGSNAKVNNVGPGFDWTSGQVVLQTAQPVTFYHKQRKPEQTRPTGGFNFNGEECRM